MKLQIISSAALVLLSAVVHGAQVAETAPESVAPVSDASADAVPSENSKDEVSNDRVPFEEWVPFEDSEESTDVVPFDESMDAGPNEDSDDVMPFEDLDWDSEDYEDLEDVTESEDAGNQCRRSKPNCDDGRSPRCRRNNNGKWRWVCDRGNNNNNGCRRRERPNCRGNRNRSVCTRNSGWQCRGGSNNNNNGCRGRRPNCRGSNNAVCTRNDGWQCRRGGNNNNNGCRRRSRPNCRGGRNRAVCTRNDGWQCRRNQDESVDLEIE